MAIHKAESWSVSLTLEGDVRGFPSAQELDPRQACELGGVGSRLSLAVNIAIGP